MKSSLRPRMKESKRADIIRHYKTGKYTLRELSGKFGVSVWWIFMLTHDKARAIATEKTNLRKKKIAREAIKNLEAEVSMMFERGLKEHARK